ncbi:DUF4377 domain-containing protein [Plebeiibacterium sediminum]|uniref:DUF4377 domain-containing protein n=1 Tax=Plebeiibacterium sediminum TaxID=2992112 RepID=A0AAE3M3E4_9BACT|nr:DUF4377 domain-containing protein [Plebeiobacterium sediminum]MCW3786040.1 DUF4377 domain-containing protein [Plebeiobacterium sediminum]
MKTLNLFFGFTFLCTLFMGCTKDENDKEKIVEITIYPETGYGASMMSDIWTQPLLFSDNDENQVKLLVDIITDGFDFDYERGYEYKFRAKKVWMQEPPQDVFSIKYEFIELLSKERVIINDSEENINLFVSSKTVKFTPDYPSEYVDEENITPKIYDALNVKNTDSDNWMALTKIEGFNYETGYEYVLKVKKITQAEPYSVKYVLLETISKENKN